MTSPRRAGRSDSGFQLVKLEEVDSTNELLLRSDLEVYPLGTALLAATQTRGRGRHDREWQSSKGGMFLSVVFRPNRIEALSLLGAYAVVRLCQEEFDLTPVLRWPNDVYVEGRKLAGVLPQVKFAGSRVERAVLGVGLNVNQSLKLFPAELEERVTTLSHLLGRSLEMELVVAKFLTILASEVDRYELQGPEGLVERCEAYLEGLNRAAYALTEDGERRPLGRICGLGPAGELRLDRGEPLINLGPSERLTF